MEMTIDFKKNAFLDTRCNFFFLFCASGDVHLLRLREVGPEKKGRIHVRVQVSRGPGPPVTDNKNRRLLLTFLDWSGTLVTRHVDTRALPDARLVHVSSVHIAFGASSHYLRIKSASPPPPFPPAPPCCSQSVLEPKRHEPTRFHPSKTNASQVQVQPLRLVAHALTINLF